MDIEKASKKDQLLNLYRKLRFRHGFRLGQRTWSQEGEDLIITRICPEPKGFYVDVGAHHPFRYSNTYRLYQRGWRGINIDPLQKTIDLFHRHRPHDINIVAGIAREEGEMTYYQFNDSAFNTFNSDAANSVLRNHSHIYMVKKANVKTIPLELILDRHLPPQTDIDILNIDAEGMDLAVLKSNNWDRYRPKVVVTEILNHSIESALKSETYLFMKSHGYAAHSKLHNTVIFKR